MDVGLGKWPLNPGVLMGRGKTAIKTRGFNGCGKTHVEQVRKNTNDM